MKLLLLLTIALALTPTVYSKTFDSNDAAEKIDRDKYEYSCTAGFYISQCIPNLKRGDLLDQLRPNQAVLYCDPKKPIVRTGGYNISHPENPIYVCIYNGREIKEFSAEKLNKK